MTTRNDEIVRLLRPARDELSSLSLLALPKVRDVYEYVVWCDCHQDWYCQVDVTGMYVDAALERYPEDYPAERKAFTIALERATRVHLEAGR